jgi:hypothetical protein
MIIKKKKKKVPIAALLLETCWNQGTYVGKGWELILRGWILYIYRYFIHHSLNKNIAFFYSNQRNFIKISGPLKRWKTRKQVEIVLVVPGN